ncbi:MAG TPA: glycosyltransferase family 4 protein [Opitutaceae bacterium]|jgi:glycosyltransferase involved in cell wall biosynthesis|nr:glycosyltransferase family 4 protein [Opitutaceae bacterium]
MRLTVVTGFFLPVPPVRGGSTEKIWHRLAQEWAAAGEEVTLVSRRWPGFPDREVSGGVRHLRLPGSDHSSSLVRNLWHDFRWGLRVGRALPPGDVVICNTVTLPVWLRRFRPRAGRVVAVAARMPKGHGRAYGAVDLILALGEPVARKLREENPALAGRIAPFPYPIDWKLHAEAAAAKPGPGEPVTIGYVGRIHPEKGLELLLGAAGRLAGRAGMPAWRLQLAGPAGVAAGGGGEAWWQTLRSRHAAALGGRLEWTGPDFDPASLARRYGGMDIFCYPSVAEQGETFGVAVAEAMAARCAPVVSALACFDQLVRDGDTGLVFDHRGPDPVRSLEGTLARLLGDAGERRSLAERAQAHVRQFDYSSSARELLARLSALAAP